MRNICDCIEVPKKGGGSVGGGHLSASGADNREFPCDLHNRVKSSVMIKIRFWDNLDTRYFV